MPTFKYINFCLLSFSCSYKDWVLKGLFIHDMLRSQALGFKKEGMLDKLPELSNFVGSIYAYAIQWC